MTAVDLLKKLFEKAGIAPESELTNDISDELATRLDNSLLTISAATNNHPLVKRHYVGQAWKGLESQITTLMDEYDLPEEARAEIESLGLGENGEKIGSTPKKINALVKKIKELSAKAEPADSGKAAQLNQQIIDLRKTLADELKSKDQIKNDFEKQLKQIKIQTALESMLGGYKTVYDEIPDAKGPAIQAIINKALQDSDADFTFDEKGQLSLLKKDGSSLFGDNHTLINPKLFLDKSLSKILKVSSATQTGQQIQTTPALSVNGTGQQTAINTSLKNALAESLQDYEAGSKNGVPV